jgi:sugar phosphate isomerase/epimerase
LFEPFTFLDHCHRLGAGGIQIPLGVLEEVRARQLRIKAEGYAMFVEGIVAPPYQPGDRLRFEAEIRSASQAGARAVRTLLVPGRRYEQFANFADFQRASAQGRRALEWAEPVVKRHRVRLAVENHKDHRATDLLAILKHVSSPYVGACVDVGNNLALLEDPQTVVELLAPWAFSVHLKDHVLREYADGFLLGEVALGQGCLDLKKIVEVLRRAQPGLCFCLEIITRDLLRVPCLTERYWAACPDLSGRDLARTLRLARQQMEVKMPEVGKLSRDEQAKLEEKSVTSSLAFAKDHLGL